MADRNYEFAVLRGDGVGDEVVREGLRVLEAVSAMDGFRYRTTEFPFGAEHYLRTGETMPESAIREMGDFDAILLGAIGDPRIEVGMLERAIIAGLRHLKVRRVAVATAYIDEVNTQLRTYLELSDFEPLALEGLAISDVQAVGQVPTQVLVDLCLKVFEDQPGADGLLISCGGLVTLDAVREVEARLQVPVVSSSPAGFWDLVRTAGLDARSPGQGRLFG